MFSIAEYRRKGKRLSDYLPWAGLVHPRVMLNKDGSFLAAYRFRGPDLDSCSEHELIATRARMNNALRRLGSRWCLHVEAHRRTSQQYPASHFPDPVTAAIEAERRKSFELDQTHFESDHTLVLTYLPPEERVAAGRDLFVESAAAQAGMDYRRELDGFLQEADRIGGLLRSFMPQVVELKEAELLTYLHQCVSTRRHLHVALPPVPFSLDEMLTDDDLTGGFEPKLGDQFLQTISVRAYPHRTMPGLLDGLNQLALPYRWVVRWLPLDKSDAEKLIASLRRQWFAKRKGLASLLKEVITKEASALEDSDSVNKAHDADEALQYLGADLCSFGYLTLTVTVWDRDLHRAREKAAAVQRVIDGVGLVCKVETVNAVEAWLGSLPGHAYADVRRPIIGSLNLCDLIPLSSVWPGPRRCEHLNGPVLLQARTKGATPFRLSLFQGDVGHTMVCGPTGAGKSTLLNILAAQWRRYPDAQVYFFDKGGSCKVLTLAGGGDHYDLGSSEGGAAGGALSFQPLARVHEPPERLWAQEWLLDILAREQVSADPILKEELWRVLELLGSAELHDRTLSSLVNLLQHREAKEALRRYTLAGSYGHLLDAHEDRLNVGHWQAFETEQLMQSKAATAAVLTYLFHRLEERFAAESTGGRPTLLILDEAWVFLADGLFAAKIREWLKVLRKRNVAVVFATQSLSDIADSPIAPALIENCLTRIFLPNARAMEPAVRKVYEAFGLTEQQLRLLSAAAPKRDYYYQSREGDRLFELGLGPLALAFCAASSHDDRMLADRMLREHPRAEFASRFLAGRGLAVSSTLSNERSSS
jgi:type IV secretion system protein TrbE